MNDQYSQALRDLERGLRAGLYKDGSARPLGPLTRALAAHGVPRVASGARGGRMGHIFATAVVAIAILVAGGAVALLAGHQQSPTGHRGSRPPHRTPPVAPSRGAHRRASPQQIRELSYITGAQHRHTKDPACRTRGELSPRGPAVNEGTPSATMLSVLGVLRRPATAADRLPAGFYRHGRLLADRISNDVYVRYIRLARVENGVSYYIVPVATIGSPPPPAHTLARCYAEQMSALRRQMSRAPASTRTATLSLGAGCSPSNAPPGPRVASTKAFSR